MLGSPFTYKGNEKEYEYNIISMNIFAYDVRQNRASLFGEKSCFYFGGGI